MPPQIQRVAHYEIAERLGVGGMGVVYRANDTRLGRQVALKFLGAQWLDRPDAKERFLREAQAASRLDHPNICTVHDVVEDEEQSLFIVMAFVDGQTVGQILRNQGQMALEPALSIVAQVASGLAKAHAAGIVHRDIKPANIMITREGLAKILDFGLAQIEGSKLTKPGSMAGTLTYMAPEQMLGATVDARADVWALGLLFYEMLAGRNPFEADSDGAVIQAILNRQPERLGRIVASLPAEIEETIDRCLRRKPEARFANAGELLRAISADSPPSLLMNRVVTVAASAPTSIAVLPFADHSPHKDQEYLCAGLAEELMLALCRVAGLQVASRTSVQQFRDSNEDVRDIGRRLGVDSILEGSVRTAGDRMRVSVQLVSVQSGLQLWADRWDVVLRDVFEIQDRIAREVAQALRSRLEAPEDVTLVEPYSGELDVYILYLKGRHQWSRRAESGLRQGIDLFQQAIDGDPRFGRAYAGLADCYAMLGTYGLEAPSEVMPKAMAAAERALDIGSHPAEAHASLGLVEAIHGWKWETARGHFKAALELDPGNAMARQWYAMNYLLPLGRVEAALGELNEAVVSDPLALSIHASLGRALYFAWRLEDSARVLRETLELDDRFAVARYFLGQTLLELGLFEAALEHLQLARELSPESPETLAALGLAQAAQGDSDAARHVLEHLTEMARTRYVDRTLLAQLHLALDDRCAAVEQLQHAVAQRSVGLIWLHLHPAFEKLREHDVVTGILSQIGLVSDA